ncbi:MAG: MBL fold metallo-hydrolase [Thermofilaceae archaeon]|nr:MBL fold metallo-hydrolase [Thermofilaceae archaeon]
MSIKVYPNGGLLVEIKGRKILLDPTSLPSEKPDAVFVSHAHSDHYNFKTLRIMEGIPKVMSQATWELIDPKRRLDNVTIVESGDSVEVAGLAMEVHEAGHVIGSLQLLIDAGLRMVYTGDFNLDRRLVLKSAPILKTDVLVIDSTYGHPRYTFPPRAQLYREILRTVRAFLEENKGVALATRVLGTGQEVTALLSLVAKVVPFVDRRVAEKNRVYEKHGEILGSYVVNTSAPPRSAAAVVPLSARYCNSIPCTGWATNSGFPLSSHAGFTDLIKYVLESEANEVFAFWGFAEYFADVLRRELGVHAYAYQH